MFVYERFPGDNDTVLMEIQNRLYSMVLGVVFEYPRKRYLESARLLLADTELTKRLWAMNTFDHRTLQETHDLIAARFRFSRYASAQQTLFETNREHEERIEREWRSFLRQEVRYLCDDDDFVRAVVTATAFPNADAQGCAAEAKLRALLTNRYWDMKLDRKNG